MKTYRFYGWETADVSPVDPLYKKIENPRMLYDLLSELWSKETCAPRLQSQWSKSNKTLGQCSITAFLVQDIFGGDVYGIPLEDGNFHCYNDVNGVVFDLTSEQFPGRVLCYRENPLQRRETHFSKVEKKMRYANLKKSLIEKIADISEN